VIRFYTLGLSAKFCPPHGHKRDPDSAALEEKYVIFSFFEALRP
jgi:hypothetical protein